MKRALALVFALGCSAPSAALDAGADARQTPMGATPLGCAPGDGTPQPVCDENHFCWSDPQPLSSTSQIAGGGCDVWLQAAGAVYRMNGATVTRVPFAPQVGQNGIQVFPTEVWTAGYGVYRFDGKTWTQFDPYGSAMWGSSETDVWFARTTNQLAHWNGHTVTNVDLADDSFSQVTQMWGTGPDDIRAVVGFDFISFLHWNGIQWTAEPGPPVFGPAAIWGATPDSWYVVGEGNQGPEVWRREGDGWALVVREMREVNDRFSISGSGPNDVWVALGRDYVLRFDGTSWSQIALPPGANVAAVHAAAPDDVVLAGDRFLGRWDGSQIVTLSSAMPLGGQNAGWLDIHPGDGDELWAVSSLGTIGHWDGAHWTSETHDLGGGPFFSQGGASGAGSEFWLYTNGFEGSAVFHYRAGSWTRFDAPMPTIMLAIDATDPDDVWICGEEVAHYDGQWHQVPTPFGIYYGIWAHAGEVWIAGSGVVLRRSSTGWTEIPVPPLDYFAIWGRSANDIYLGDRSGDLYHWDGQLFTHVMTVGFGPVTSIGGDATRVWAVTEGGIAIDDGNGFRTFNTRGGTKAYFPSSTDGWLMSSTAILRYRP